MRQGGCGPWWRCTWSEGAKRWISAPHCLTTLIGQTTRVGPRGSSPASSRSDASIAIACTVFPRPMSSARIPPTPRSPSSRSQPWPRSWNGKSGCVIAAGVGSARKRRSPAPRREESGSSSVTSPSSTPASSVSSPDTARTSSTIPMPARRRSRKRSAFSTSARRTACQRSPMRTKGSFAAARSASSSSVSSVSPTASRQSNRASSVGERKPLERTRGALVAVRLTRMRVGERSHDAGSRTGTSRSSSFGIASRRKSRTCSGPSSASDGSAVSNSIPIAASTGSSSSRWRIRSRRGSPERRNAKTSPSRSQSSDAGRPRVGSSPACSQSSSTSRGSSPGFGEGRSSRWRPSRHSVRARVSSPPSTQSESRFSRAARPEWRGSTESVAVSPSSRWSIAFARPALEGASRTPSARRRSRAIWSTRTG